MAGRRIVVIELSCGCEIETKNQPQRSQDYFVYCETCGRNVIITSWHVDEVQQTPASRKEVVDEN